LTFYSLVDYNKWKEENDEATWSIKYYKGLGTSTAKEAKEYFSQLATH
jgi:DNA topoisomerase II